MKSVKENCVSGATLMIESLLAFNLAVLLYQDSFVFT